ncbi:hypothetical protein DACRYDRAFT_24596 [Dacryopinax primogenitus]|uniref:YCII-related domain-containing protein n=1 Tax=Dacryopinax primogenitus (strain DJM 731) TaxID=1858805 RepID=M5FSA6_DACPD|nr:uncharacterized protein DACRYDRAFT_24596 [Dacryopinax primogenitus]EJT98054.1 hypothetical protein DACRYDRAFT_24596 [Dacryopinax primogenitus]
MSKVFFVYAPDFTDEAAPERRNSVRAEHLKVAAARTNTLLGGPMVTEEGKMTGSTMFINADSEEKVRAIVESDIYYKSGVWDPANIAIWWYRPAGPPKV